MTSRTERELRDLTRELGWDVVRAAGSHGPRDLVLLTAVPRTNGAPVGPYCLAVSVQEKSLKGPEPPVFRWSDNAALKEEWIHLTAALAKGMDTLIALRWRAPSHVAVPGGRWRFERFSRIPHGPKGYGILRFADARLLEDALNPTLPVPTTGARCAHCGATLSPADHTMHELHACGHCQVCGKEAP